MSSTTTLLNPALRGFYESKGIRNYVLYGGRASSKTYHTAAFCVFLAANYRVKFLCTRQFQNRISDSVKSVIEECIYKLGMQDQFHITENSISYPKTGATFTFLGIQRNLKEIKGIANVDVLWIEEAEDLGPEQWEVLEPTIRANHSKIFIVFNPRLSSDFVYRRFVVNPPADTIVRKINYDENPYLSGTMQKIISAAKEEDYEHYLHIYEGMPREDDESVVIKRSWIMAAVDAHTKLEIEPTGSKRMGFDIADGGEDACALIYAHGFHASWGDVWNATEDQLLKSCTRAYHAARDRLADITYDSIGVGAAAGAKFGEINTAMTGKAVKYAKFNAGASVWRPEAIYEAQTKNKDQFANLKAQTWWLVADRFRNTYNAVKHGQKFDACDLISIASDMPGLEQLIDELSTPKRDFDASGKVKVESKKDLAKREVKSPNRADAFVMAFAPRPEAMVINPNLIRNRQR